MSRKSQKTPSASGESPDWIAKVMEIYAEWQARASARDCVGRADCCRFRLSGHVPYLTAGEALVAAKAWRAAGRKDFSVPADGSCPFLHPQAGTCRIYAGRPFGCRTHFCPTAGGPASRHEVRDLIQRLEDIDHELGGKGAMQLPTAMKTIEGPMFKCAVSRGRS